MPDITAGEQAAIAGDGGSRSLARTTSTHEETKKRAWTAEQDQLLTKLVRVIPDRCANR